MKDIHQAVIASDYVAVETLAQADAWQLEARDKMGRTPMEVARVYDNWTMVAFILELKLRLYEKTE